MDNFEFLGPNLPKNGFWGRHFKSLSLDLESVSLRYYKHQFSDKTDNFEFLGPNLPKNEFQNWNFKNLSLDSKSTPPIYHVCQIFTQTGQRLIFRPKFGEIAQLQYFGSNIVEGVAESWIEAEMSRVEVNGAGWRLK